MADNSASMAAIFGAMSSDGSPIPLRVVARVHGDHLADRLRKFMATEPAPKRAGWFGSPLVSRAQWLTFCATAIALDAQHFSRCAMEHNLTAAATLSSSNRLIRTTTNIPILERTASGSLAGHQWNAEDRYEESHLYVDGIPEDRVADVADYKFFLYRKVFSTPFAQPIDVDTRSMPFGEINFSRFQEKVLQGLKLNHGSTFVDLGSGVGKACMTAHLICPFSLVLGVESRPSLHAVATEALVKMTKLKCLRSDGIIEFVNLNLLMFDKFMEFDVVFTSCASFSEVEMQHIVKGVAQMKPGAYLITTTPMIVDEMQLIKTEQLPMSWDSFGVDVHIYKKKDLRDLFTRIDQALSSEPAAEDAAALGLAATARTTSNVSRTTCCHE